MKNSISLDNIKSSKKAKYLLSFSNFSLSRKQFIHAVFIENDKVSHKNTIVGMQDFWNNHRLSFRIYLLDTQTNFRIYK